MNCNCQAYGFPHRPLGGRCDGSDALNKVFEKGEACQNCNDCIETRDPFCTGDFWFSERDCGGRADSCPGIHQ